MGKILGIKGHSTRGKEVIELLQMMGGEAIAAKGNDETAIYVIPVNGIIDVRYTFEKRIDNYAIFTLEQFWEKYPYKVGDVIKFPNNMAEEIAEMKWDEELQDIIYTSVSGWSRPCHVPKNIKNKTDCKKCGLHFGSVRCFAIDCPHNTPKSNAVGLKDCKVIDCITNKKTDMNKNKPLFKPGDVVKLKGCSDKNLFWIIMDVIEDGYIFNDGKKYSFDDQHHYEKSNREVINTKPSKMKNVLAELLEHIKTTPKEELEREFEEIESEGWTNVGPTVEEFRTFCERVNKKPAYPTTYEECCDTLKISNDERSIDVPLDYDKLLSTFTKLLICRKAYWKIAGEEMGLGKLWEPNWTTFEGMPAIFTFRYNIVCDFIKNQHCLLVFPTEEMRDAFYKNFKGLIEQCKELL